jgi:tape measure domain-containing protein
MAQGAEVERLVVTFVGDRRDLDNSYRAASQGARKTANEIQGIFGERGLFTAFRRNLTDLSSARDSFIKQTLAVSAGDILTGGLSKAASMTKDLTMRGIEYNALLERSHISFGVLLKDQEKAKQHMADLQAFALKAGSFQLADVIGGSQRLQAMGFEADRVIEILTNVSDAASAMGGSKDVLDGIVTALGQMKGNGRLAAEEMNQLTERGIPAWKMLSELTGKSEQQLRKLSSQGKLRGDVAVEGFLLKFKEYYGGLGEKLATTFDGSVSNFEDRLDQRLAQATLAGFARTKTVLDQASTILGSSQGEQVAQGISNITDKALLPLDLALKAIATGGNFTALFSNLGASMGDGLMEGVQDRIDELFGVGVKMGEAVKDGVKKSGGIQSPAKEFIKLGHFMAQGMTQGFVEGQNPEETTRRILERYYKKKDVDAIIKKGVRVGPGMWTSGNREWDETIRSQSARTGVPADLLFTQLLQESRFSPNAVGPMTRFGTAKGMAQFIDSTAGSYNLSNPFDPIDSIRAQAEYMRDLMRQFSAQGERAEAFALAGYNWGPAHDTLQRGSLASLPHQTNDYLRVIQGITGEVRSGQPVPVRVENLDPLTQSIVAAAEQTLANRQPVQNPQTVTLGGDLTGGAAQMPGGQHIAAVTVESQTDFSDAGNIEQRRRILRAAIEQKLQSELEFFKAQQFLKDEPARRAEMEQAIAHLQEMQRKYDELSKSLGDFASEEQRITEVERSFGVQSAKTTEQLARSNQVLDHGAVAQANARKEADKLNTTFEQQARTAKSTAERLRELNTEVARQNELDALGPPPEMKAPVKKDQDAFFERLTDMGENKDRFKPIRDAFVDSFRDAFSTTEGGFKGMLSRFVLSFTQALADMATNRLAKTVGGVLFGDGESDDSGSGGGGLFGMIFGAVLGGLFGGGGGGGNANGLPAWTSVPGLFGGAHASGGVLFGPGTGTSDSIVIRASNGEGILTADAVNYYGGASFVSSLNNKELPRHAYATGGIVGDPVLSLPQSPGSLGYLNDGQASGPGAGSGQTINYNYSPQFPNPTGTVPVESSYQAALRGAHQLTHELERSGEH